MSVWQFAAAVEGWAKVHCPDDDKTLSAEEADDLWEWLNDGN
ncbi:MAG: hypothetical protein WBB98_15265 [Xanthobacteraceae bacterium]